MFARPFFDADFFFRVSCTKIRSSWITFIVFGNNQFVSRIMIEMVEIERDRGAIERKHFPREYFGCR